MTTTVPPTTGGAAGGTALAERVAPRLKQRYADEISAALREEFHYANVM